MLSLQTGRRGLPSTPWRAPGDEKETASSSSIQKASAAFVLLWMARQPRTYFHENIHNNYSDLDCRPGSENEEARHAPFAARPVRRASFERPASDSRAVARIAVRSNRSAG